MVLPIVCYLNKTRWAAYLLLLSQLVQVLNDVNWERFCLPKHFHFRHLNANIKLSFLKKLGVSVVIYSQFFWFLSWERLKTMHQIVAIFTMAKSKLFPQSIRKLQTWMVNAPQLVLNEPAIVLCLNYAVQPFPSQWNLTCSSYRLVRIETARFSF